jgi:hypothetical protein
LQLADERNSQTNTGKCCHNIGKSLASTLCLCWGNGALCGTSALAMALITGGHVLIVA